MKYKPHYAWLTNLCFNLTDACNLACRYCFVEQHPHYMSLDTAKKAVEWEAQNLNKKKQAGLLRKQRANLVFFGGEPMLCYDTIIVPLVEWIEENYPDIFSLSMTTNGTLLNEERIEWLHQHDIGLLLSIDGAPETQNYNRPCQNGCNSYDLIAPNLPCLLHYYPNLTFRSTIHKDTVEHTFENYAFAVSMGFKNIFIIPNCREEWPEDKIMILNQEYEKIYDFFIAGMQGELPMIHNSRINDSFKEVLRHDLDVLSDLFEKKSNNLRVVERCGLGTGMGSIGYDGSIYGCQEQTSRDEKNIFLIGNIYEGGIDEARHLQLLKEYHYGKTVECSDAKICNNCPLASQCSNKACPSTTWDLSHDFDIFPKMYCIWLQIQFYQASRAMKILVEENNQQFKRYLNKTCHFEDYFQEEGGKL